MESTEHQSGREASLMRAGPRHAAAQPPAIALFEQEPTFKALLEAAPDAIVIVDHAGSIMIVNAQTERLFGYDRNELLGQPVELLLPEQLRTLHRRHRAGFVADPHTRPMGAGFELVARRKDGSQFAVEISLSPLQTQEGLLVTSVIRDVSERKRALDELNVRVRQQAVVAALGQRALTTSELDPLLNEVASLILEPLGVEYCGILDLLRDGTALRLRAGSGWTAGAVGQATIPAGTDSFAGYTLLANAPVIVDDFRTEARFHVPPMLREHGAVSGLSAIIQAQDRPFGVLYAVTSRGRTFTAHDVNFLQAVANVVASAVERTRGAAELERQIRYRTTHLNALVQFSRELFRARAIDEVLREALSQALSLVPEARAGAIYLCDQPGQRLGLRASAGFSLLPPMTLAANQGLIGEALQTGDAQFASSAEEVRDRAPLPGADDASRQATDRAQTTPTGAAAVPLQAHAQIIGVLLLTRDDGDGPFAVEARATLEGLANLAASAVFEERSRHEATTLSEQLARSEAQQRTMTEKLTSAEASLVQAARLAAVGQLAAAVAHEINNPLYATRNALFLLEEELPEALRGSPFLTLAREQLGRIARIIERMRDFYRPTHGDQAAANLNTLLEETLAVAQLNLRFGAINMIFTPAADLAPVVCNADQLRQVFLNLVLNAIDAMPDGGTLTVRTASRPDVAIVEIADTGVGMPEEVQGRLFEPFYTTKASGTGLGLPISGHIVTQHGGLIAVDSLPGRGTTFRISLPYQLAG
jgi:two-component system NtrC family sensor kinase